MPNSKIQKFQKRVKNLKKLIFLRNYNFIAKIRTEYIHKTQKAIEQRILNCENILKNTESSSEKAKTLKEKNKLIKQLEESIEYDEALNHVSNLNINLNLDDGIKFNHDKFQNIKITKEGIKDKKINLLKKI